MLNVVVKASLEDTHVVVSSGTGTFKVTPGIDTQG